MSELELVKPDVVASVEAAVQAVDQQALSELTDLFCSLSEQHAAVFAKAKLAEKEIAPVEAQLQSALDSGYSESAEALVKTGAYTLSAGAKGKVLTVTDKKKLIALLGSDLFLELAQVSVTDMRKYLTEAQLKLVAKDVFKNKRKLTFAKAGS